VDMTIDKTNYLSQETYDLLFAIIVSPTCPFSVTVAFFGMFLVGVLSHFATV